MEVNKRILAAFSCAVLIGCLSGCIEEITGASPDPSVEITMAPGESVSLQVDGPSMVQNLLWYSWIVQDASGVNYFDGDCAYNETTYPDQPFIFTIPVDI